MLGLVPVGQSLVSVAMYCEFEAEQGVMRGIAMQISGFTTAGMLISLAVAAAIGIYAVKNHIQLNDGEHSVL
jgi:hypothetical protein